MPQEVCSKISSSPQISCSNFLPVQSTSLSLRLSSACSCINIVPLTVSVTAIVPPPVCQLLFPLPAWSLTTPLDSTPLHLSIGANGAREPRRRQTSLHAARRLSNPALVRRADLWWKSYVAARSRSCRYHVHVSQLSRLLQYVYWMRGGQLHP